MFEFRNHVKYFQKPYTFSDTQSKYYTHQVWDLFDLFKLLGFLVLLSLILYFFSQLSDCQGLVSLFFFILPKGKEIVLYYDVPQNIGQEMHMFL